MPFQGNPNAGAVDPGLMSLLFQARKDRAALALQQKKAQMDAERQAKQDARDDMMFRADMAKKLLELNKAKSEGEAAGKESAAGLAPKLDLSLDENAAPAERQAGGASYIQGLKESAQLAAGFDPMGNPNPVTGDILNRLGNEAAAASGLARVGKREGVEEQEVSAEIADKYARRREARDEARQIRIAKKRAEIDAELAKSGGEFNPEAMRSTRNLFDEEAKPAIANEKTWGFYNRFDPNNKQQIIDAVQLAQRAIDPVNVTEGDMRLRAAAGVDTQGALLRRLDEWSTGAVSIPTDLGPVIKENLREKLEIADDMNLMTLEQQEEYIAENGLSPSQRNFLLRHKRVLERLRDRVKKRGELTEDPPTTVAAPTGRPPTPSRTPISTSRARSLGLE